MALGFQGQKQALVVMANGESARRLWLEIIPEIFGVDQPALTWLYQLYDQTGE